MREERWGSVGFRLDDQTAPRECRRAALRMLEEFGLTHSIFGDLADDVQTIISELVTNAQRHAGSTFPAASFTMWHPNRWLALTVHDKGTYMPLRETARAATLGEPSWDESGRGLRLVCCLAERHCGEVDWHRDGDRRMPGKVVRVRLLLPHLWWRNTFRDPWTGRIITG